MKIRNRSSSLKHRLLLLVALCWIIPVIVLGGYCYFYYVKSVNDKILNSMSNEIRFASSMAAENIDSIIKISRRITYDQITDQSYKRYLKTGDGAVLCQTLNKYLYLRSSDNSLIDFSTIYLKNEPNLTLYYSKNGIETVNYYKKHILPQLVQFSSNLNGKIGFLVSDQHIYIVRNLVGDVGDSISREYGIAVLEVNMEEAFKNLSQDEIWSPNLNFSINHCIGKIGENAKIKLNIDELTENQSDIIKENDVYVFRGSIKKNDFNFGYRTEVSKDILNEEFESYLWLMVLLTAVIVPVLLLTLRFFYINFTKPLQQLISAGEHLEHQNFGYQIEMENVNSEFSYLIKTFNDMSQQLEYLFKKTYKEEIALRDSKLMALQSQINPHFLNNTLELMNWQARFAGDTAVSKMIESLSILMDAALDRSGKRIIELSNELKCADAYLYIINQRFGDRLTVSKEIDETLLNFKVPPLIIQPLLENAVEHGIEPVTNGHIDIKIYQQSGYLNIDIINTGALLKEEDIKKIDILLHTSEGENIKSSTSLGIRNVNIRLKLIYGESSNLNIFPDENGNTLSKVVIPMEKTEQ